MISRYSRPEMAAIWEQANKFRIWYEIEAHACDAQANLGVIPSEAAKEVWNKGDKPYTKDRIKKISEIEKETKHDVIAFLTELAEQIGSASRFVHQGMTSSDILDTCLSVQLTKATDLLIKGMDRLLSSLKKRAVEFKMTPCIGRSHGIHAEPTTFGLKLARFYAEFSRNRIRLGQARSEINICAISGAVGTFANISPEVEEYVALKLGLDVEPVSSQVIPRDRHASFFSTLAVISGSIENLATEIRHLQRTEVREAQEFFSSGQKGSSAMPHKRNPILSENLTGLARIIRASVIPALENITLWHERDISHSSVERIMAPDSTILLDFSLHRLADIVDGLVVYPANMKENLDKFGGIHDAQRVMLKLTQKGMSREQAYKMVQVASMEVWRSFGLDPDSSEKFSQTLGSNNDIENCENRLLYFLSRNKELSRYLKKDEVKDLIREEATDYHLVRVDEIFERVFGS